MSLAFGMGYHAGDSTMTFGENSVREARSGCCFGIHAEMDAIRKLPPLQFKRKKKILNLIVIRVDKNGLLKNSAPCSMCIKHMENLNNTTSYKIQNVCYSNEIGNIVMMKFNTLKYSSENHVSMRFRRKSINY